LKSRQISLHVYREFQMPRMHASGRLGWIRRLRSPTKSVKSAETSVNVPWHEQLMSEAH